MDPALLALATRMRSACACEWTAADRQRIIAYLAPVNGVHPDPRFPLRLVRMPSAPTTWAIYPNP